MSESPNIQENLTKVASQLNQTEQDVLGTIDGVINLLAPGFVFGYFDIEDIKQEARIDALKALAKYDSSRPLENFLYTHVKNRLINLKRDRFHRNDPPCMVCHQKEGPTEHPDGKICQKYKVWKKRNSTKSNLMKPVDIEKVEEPIERGATEQVELNELLQRIDDKLPIELRSAYLQMRAGLPVSKDRRKAVEDCVRSIMGDPDGN